MLLLLKLLIGHALSDFALQNPDMAKLKNRHNKPENIPKGQKLTPCWFYFLTAHALIHGGVVWAITGIWWTGIIEMFSHWIIDFFKCENITNPHIDQALHIFVKLVIVLLLM